jgi:hypothetical protein
MTINKKTTRVLFICKDSAPLERMPLAMMAGGSIG